MTTDEKIDEILRLMRTFVAGVKAATAPAEAADIDGKYGNPTVRKDPKTWDGESMVGRTYSECPPDYLRKLAGLLEWKAKKTEEEADPERQKYVAYDRKDAARARAWADRIERQPQPKTGKAPAEDWPAPVDDDPGLPF